MNENADERLTQLQDLIARGSRVVIGTREEVHEYILTLMELVPQVISDLKNARVPTETKCPMCGLLHVDQEDWVNKIPHRKHQCASCHYIWQPYAVGTVGVDFHVQCRAAREAADLCVGELRRQVGERLAEQEKIQKLERDVAALETRRDELLALVAKLSQTVPLESEVGEALQQRGVLLAEVGTLKATITEHDSLFQQALTDRQFIEDVLAGVGPFMPRATKRTVSGIVGGVKTLYEAVKELQRGIHTACAHATTHLPEDREVINEVHKLAHKDYLA